MANPSSLRSPATDVQGKTVLIVRNHPDYLVRFHGPLIEMLVGKGHRVVCCCSDAEDHHVEALHAFGAEYHDFPFNRRGVNPFEDWASYRAFSSFVKGLCPEVALLITVKPVIYGVRALRKHGCKHVYGMMCGMGYVFGDHDTFKQRLVGKIGAYLMKSALRQCSGVLLHNPDDAAELRDLGVLTEKNPTYITYGSGIDVSKFQETPLPDRLRVLTIARLIAAKGIRDFATAARIVRERRPDVSFALVGWFEEGADASSREEVEGGVESGDIEFLGRLSDVRPALAESSIFALATYYREGLPRTILEAMAMGRPIVTTNAPGCKETVQGGANGFIVPQRDPEAFAAALLELLEDPEMMRRMAAESRKQAVERFDCDVNARGIVDYINTTTAEPLL